MMRLDKALLITLLALPVIAASSWHPPVVVSATASPADVATGGVDDGESQPEGTLSQEEIQRFHIQALEVFRVRDAELQQIEALDSVSRTAIVVRLGQRERTIRLYPHSLRAADFVVLVPDEQGALVQTEVPPPTTYRGRIDGDPGAQVAASVIDGQLHALILMDNGEQWAIQPLNEELPSAPANLHVVYRVSDVIGQEGTCGVDQSMVAMPVDDIGGEQDADSEKGSPIAGGILGRTEIAFDADFEFYQANGSSVATTVQDIEMVMNLVGVIYQNQLSICFALTGIIVRNAEPDPYTSTAAATLLCEFRDFWNANVSIQRDVAHLWTGKTLTGGMGVAWVGVICNLDGSSTGCTNTANLAYALSSRPTNLTSRTILAAQEIGHNFNACHCNNGGCPPSDPSCCTGGGTDPDCGIMCSMLSCATATFGARAITTITTFRDTRSCLDTCRDPTYVDWSNLFPGDGSSTFPFHTVDEGVRYVPVGGTVIIFMGSYPENLTIHKTVTLTVNPAGGVVTIGD